jgi:hypothetical protein
MDSKTHPLPAEEDVGIDIIGAGITGKSLAG